MTIPFKKYIWHTFYLTLILGSLWYWKRQRDFHQTWLEFVEPTNKNVIDFLEKQGAQLMAGIEKSSYDYPSHHADSIMAVCKNINRLQTAIQSNIRLQHDRAAQKPNAADMAILQDSIGGKWQQMIDIANALHLEDTVLVSLRPLLTPEAFDSWLSSYKNGNQQERHFLLDSQYRLVMSVKLVVLRHLFEFAESIENPLYFDAVKMVMNPKSRPIAGKRFEAEFYPVFYTTRTENISAIIDGRPYPFKDGIAHCDTVYHTPGRKSIEVALHLKNPATGQVESVKKQFEIEVIK